MTATEGTDLHGSGWIARTARGAYQIAPVLRVVRALWFVLSVAAAAHSLAEILLHDPGSWRRKTVSFDWMLR